MLNLDTHLVVHFLTGNCTEREHHLISRQEIAISDIVLWELAKLTEHRRLDMDLESAPFRGFLRRMTVFPISLEIAIASTQLDFTSDPADEIIAATSVVQKIPLLTRDRRILQSQMVPFP
ncbi:MAG TPA: PIN domain-containing protein [Terriglobia bacterium]|nr:PIN domain-containing protein [Terriglobia bacterium]